MKYYIRDDMKCYIHEVDDPNGVDFDPESHHLCVLCARKLERLTERGALMWTNEDQGLMFVLRSRIVTAPGCEIPSSTLADVLPMLEEQRLKEIRARHRALDEIYGTEQERHDARKAERAARKAARKATKEMK